MKIRMIRVASGPAGVFVAGQVYTAPEQLTVALAKAFVATGAAIDLAAPETATAPSATEKAVQPKATKRSR